jgi:hypothetical protein
MDLVYRANLDPLSVINWTQGLFGGGPLVLPPDPPGTPPWIFGPPLPPAVAPIDPTPIEPLFPPLTGDDIAAIGALGITTKTGLYQYLVELYGDPYGGGGR